MLKNILWGVKMLKKNQWINFLISILLFVLLKQFSCKSDEIISNNNILIVVAHPDDETIASGTIAKLIDRGYSVSVTYTTSGDDGQDVSGQGLSGAALAKEREEEARKSLKGLGVGNPPIFLKFPDSHVNEHIYELKDALLEVFNKVNPVVVISFGPDGITDDWDHMMTGFVTDQVFDITDSGKLLLHMAISQKANKKFRMRAPVANSAINLKVDVSAYAQARINSVNAHRTQFPHTVRERWNSIVHEVSSEEFISARNRGGEELIQKCFY